MIRNVKRKRGYLGLFVMVAILLVGCAKQEELIYPKEFMNHSDNNYFDYLQNYECSAFASAYLLRHFQEEADGVELFKNFPDKIENEQGAYPTGIVKFFENRGFRAEFVYDRSVEELKHQVSKGIPVIVFIHVEEPLESVHATHYVPVVGYDETYLYFAESLEEYANYKKKSLPYNRKTKIEDFKKLWVNIDGAWDNPYFVIEHI